MIVLNVGRADKSIFQKESPEAQRIASQGLLFEKLYVVVFALASENHEWTVLNHNTEVVPTQSRYKWLYPLDALRIARRFSFDVVSAQDPFEAGFVAWLLKILEGRKMHLQIHTDFLSPYFRQESVKNSIRVFLAKFFLKRADGVRVVSERIKHSLLTHHVAPEPKISVLPVFINTELIRTMPIKTNLKHKYPQFDFIILMASRLTREKNIPMAIHAMQSIIAEFPFTGLVIVGSGPEQDVMKKIIIENNLQNNVILEPWTNDLISYYKTADCYLLASNYEGYGRTVIEAMVSKRCVVMTDVGLAGEVVVRGVSGIVVPVGDDVALAAELKTLIKNPEKATPLVEHAFLNTQSFPDLTHYQNLYKEGIYLCL